MMNWSFGSGVNDFLVPNDQEIFDRPPQSESWLQWGRTDYETMESLSKYITPEENPTTEVRTGKRSLHQSTPPHRQSSSFLDEAAQTDRSDDIFVSSLLKEDLPAIEILDESFGFPPEFLSTSSFTDDASVNTVSDSRRVPSNSSSRSCSKYMVTDDFSLGKRKGHPPVMAPKAGFPVLAMQSGASSDETSVEESVLQEFEGVLTQFTQETRICFRDALYRLAKSSKQQSMPTESHAKEITAQSMNTVDQMPRSRAGKAMELETNAIDRTIANLMFASAEMNAQGLAPAGEDAEVPASASGESAQRTTSRHSAGGLVP